MFKHLLILAMAYSLAARSGFAQESSPSPSPSPESEETAKDHSAYLRVWTMIPAEVPAPIVGDAPKLAEDLTLVYMDEAGMPQPIASHLEPFTASGYAEYSPETRKILLVRKAGKSLQELSHTKAGMRPGMFLTVVVQKENGSYSLSILDDTPKPPEQKPGEPPPPPPKQLLLHNFLAGEAFTVSSKDASFSRNVPFGSPQLVTELPGKIFNIQVPMTVKKRQYISNIEVDLKANDSLSVLLVKNLYGQTAVMVLPTGKLE
jgi:hypothetical protein